MKNIIKIVLLTGILCIVSCDNKSERVSGSPVGVLEFENLVGNVSTTETVVSSSQNFKFTATIPKSFTTDVEVEATTTSSNGSIRKAKVLFPAGTTSATGSISSPVAIGNGAFIQSMSLYLSAINPINSVLGKQFTLSSNKVILAFGDSDSPSSNSDRCIVRFDWQGPWGELSNPLENNMDLIVKRDGVAYTTANPAPVPGNPANQRTNNTGRRYENFNIMNTYPDGDFTFEPYAASLNVPGNQSLPCRFIVVLPTDETKTVAFVLNGLTPPSIPIEKLKINKLTTAGVPKYTIIP